MSAITTLTLADGQSTPVNHTFVPYQPSTSGQPAIWYDKSPATPSGYWRITAAISQNGSKVYKTKFTVSIPILASVSAGCCVDANTPVISYTELCNIEFSSPQSSTVAQRKDLLAIAKNLLGNAMAVSAVVDLESAW